MLLLGTQEETVKLPTALLLKRSSDSKIAERQDFPRCPVVKTALPMQGVVCVQSVIRELSFHRPRGTFRKEKKVSKL